MDSQTARTAAVLMEVAEYRDEDTRVLRDFGLDPYDRAMPYKWSEDKDGKVTRAYLSMVLDPSWNRLITTGALIAVTNSDPAMARKALLQLAALAVNCVEHLDLEKEGASA